MATATPITPQPPGHRLINIDEVKCKMGWRSNASVYEWVAERGFPRPRNGSGRCARWLLSEVDKYIEELPTSELGRNPVKRKAASR